MLGMIIFDQSCNLLIDEDGNVMISDSESNQDLGLDTDTTDTDEVITEGRLHNYTYYVGWRY